MRGRQMRAAVYYRNDDVRIEEVPVPEIGPGELLVKVMASGICGSDVMEWYRRAKAPLVLGHEIAGEVTEVGEGVDCRSVGDRVTVSHHVPCNTCRYCLAGRHTLCRTLRATNFDPGGFAEYVRVPSINVDRGTLPLPKSVSFEEGTFVEPLGCVVRGHRLAHVEPASTVLVLGSGISGLLHIKLALACGARHVIATDVSTYRREAALKAGAAAAFDARDPQVAQAIRAAANGCGAQYAMVCTTATSALETALEAVDDGGTVVLFAPYEPGVLHPMPLDELWARQISVMSTYAAAPKDLQTALTLIQSGRIGVTDMITHRLGLAEAGEGFRLVAQADESLKVIVEPQR